MSNNDKKQVKIKLPAVSYDIVKLAAKLTGSSVKSFAAQAVLNAALGVTAEIENRSLGGHVEADIHLTEEEAQALLALVESLDKHDEAEGEEAEEATAEDFENEDEAVIAPAETPIEPEEKAEEMTEEKAAEAPAEEPKKAKAAKK